MKMLPACLIVLLSSLALATAGGAADPTAAQEVAPSALSAPPRHVQRVEPSAGALGAENKEHRRFRVGVRNTWFSLKDKNRPRDNSNNFIGSIDSLDERQNNVPFPFISYDLCRYFALALSYDRVRAKTLTRVDGHSDGTYDMEGPTLTGIVKYPNRTAFTPFVEGGVAFYHGDFDHSAIWRHYGNDREMVIDDTEGYLLYLGVDVHLWHAWSGQVFWRYDQVETVDTYYLNGERRTQRTIPLDNEGWGLGLSYAF